jgi:rRNA maturation RNase YbeY
VASKRSTRPTPPLDLAITAATGRQFVSFLRRHLPGAHALLPPVRRSLTEMSVALVGDRTMSRLHERFMNLSGPTDVLSFPLESDARGRVTSGEIVVCVPHALREAHARGIPPRSEVLLYALHGMLHLAGFDDRTDPGFRAMHRTEDRILSRLGLGAVFHHEPPAGSKRRGAAR